MISLFFLCYFEVKTGEWHHAKGEHSFFKAHGGTTDLPDHHRFLYNVSLVKTVSKKEKKKDETVLPVPGCDFAECQSHRGAVVLLPLPYHQVNQTGACQHFPTSHVNSYSLHELECIIF